MTISPDRPGLSPGVADDAEAHRIREVYARRAGAGSGVYGWDRAGHLFMVQDLERRMLAALRRHHLLPLAGRRILEIGCGSGHFMRELVKWGADPGLLTGIDLVEDRLAAARRRLPEEVRLENRNAAASGYAAGEFDLILQMTVFTSILDPEMRRRVAGEMLRLLAPGGRIIWYDFRVNNPRNPDVRGVGRGEIGRLFPGCTVECRAVTLAPPLARALAPISWSLSGLLNAVPLLRSHYLAVLAPAGGVA